MTAEIRQAIDRIIKLSDETVLCVEYRNESMAMSFKVEEKLLFTECTDDDSISLWNMNENACTPNQINFKLSQVKRVEFVNEDEMEKRSNGMTRISALEIELVDSSEITIFEDVN